MNASELEQWRRDLRWAILAPGPCRPQRQEMPTPQWFQEFFRALPPLQHWQPDAPPPFDRNGRPGTKVGFYFEWLWQQALQAHPDYRLLAANLPIRDGHRTLGALDLLVYNRRIQRHEHWELAIKFYLGLDNDSALGGWIGPGLEDRFDRKWQRLWDWQLPLSDHPAARSVLGQWNVTGLTHRLILKGVFFLNPEQPAIPPWLTPLAPAAHWLTLGQFRRQHREHRHAGTEAQYRRLTKPRWLALPPDPTTLPGIDPGTLQLENGPVQLLDTASCQRLFVVPDDWPARARDRLPDFGD